jgi:photosystem II stability/assembly factor-like uncharacterized protein
MTELLIATKKGLFVYDGEPGGGFELTGRAFAGEPVEYAMREPRTGRLLASVTNAFHGPKIWFTDDPGGNWTQSTGVALPTGGDAALERIWTIVAGEQEGVVYAGGDPGVLFESRDAGESWTLNDALWGHPTRPTWQPGGGGLCLHSIVPWPGDPERLTLGISAAGVWLTEDGGASWSRGNKGLVPRYMPEEARAESTDLCIHSLRRARDRPERVFMQFHGGVYRSDDGGETWTDIAAGLPSDFAFPIAVDPADPDSAFVIPLTADSDRVTAEGRARVFETRDGGSSWTARGNGLPQQDAYLTVLRHAFASASEGPQLELYFGTTQGQVYGSGDAANTWAEIASCLPTVHSVVAVTSRGV